MHLRLLFIVAQKPLMCQGLPIVKTARSRSVRHTTHGRSPVDESSAKIRAFYLTTDNIHKRQTPMLPAGFEPTIATRERSAHIV